MTIFAPAPGTNTFSFTASASGQHLLTLNNQNLAIDVASVDKIFYAGNGSDIITLTGLGNDYADISPRTSARFARLGNLYDVELNNFANIKVVSSLTNFSSGLAKSLAILHTSATGADTYTGGPAKSVLSGTGYTNEADDFTGVVVYAPGTNTSARPT